MTISLGLQRRYNFLTGLREFPLLVLSASVIESWHGGNSPA